MEFPRRVLEQTERCGPVRVVTACSRLPRLTPPLPRRGPVTSATRSAPDPDDLPQGELEFITELCAVVAEQSELQPILDWLVHKTTRLMGADECTIKLLTAGGDTARTIIFDNRRSGPEAGSRSWAPAVKASVMGYLMSHPGELASADLLA